MASGPAEDGVRVRLVVLTCWRDVAAGARLEVAMYAWLLIVERWLAGIVPSPAAMT